MFKNFIFILFIAIFLSVSTAFANAQTVDLRDQLKSLTDQVSILQLLLGVIDGASSVNSPLLPGGDVSLYESACVTLDRNLSLGSKGDDVRTLQKFLAMDSTIYPEGMITGYYGVYTRAAVRAYQLKNRIIKDAKIAGIGIVGPRTRAVLRSGCAGVESVTSNSSVKEELVVTPRIGQVPIQVIATFSINGSSCTSYKLDWGDGTVSAFFDAGIVNKCSEDIAHKEAKHTYREAGTYIVTLHSGHTSLDKAPLVGRIPVYIGVPVPTSFSIVPTSGRAPLAVSVTFPVVGSNCTSFILDWGDGTTDQYEAEQYEVCNADAGTEAKTHTFTSSGTYTVSLSTGHAPISELTENERWYVQVAENSGGSSVNFSGTSGEVPYTVNVVLSGGGAECLSYFIDWGDGTLKQSFDGEKSPNSCSADDKTFTHTYLLPGKYKVTTKVGEGSLNSIFPDSQFVEVTKPIGVLRIEQCKDKRPVCGQLSQTKCPAGYTCGAFNQNYVNICAMQADSATLVNYGECY